MRSTWGSGVAARVVCLRRKAAGKCRHGETAGGADEPGQWLSLGRNWQGDRFSPLTRINDRNRRQAGLCVGIRIPLASRPGRARTGGHAAGRRRRDLCLRPWGSAIAVDARTGKERWRYDPQVDGSYNRKACCDVVSRGLQVWKGKVYVATLDGHLVALDARDGRELWKADTLIDRDLRSYSITGPPQVAGECGRHRQQRRRVRRARLCHGLRPGQRQAAVALLLRARRSEAGPARTS